MLLSFGALAFRGLNYQRRGVVAASIEAAVEASSQARALLRGYASLITLRLLWQLQHLKLLVAVLLLKALANTTCMLWPLRG